MLPRLHAVTTPELLVRDGFAARAAALMAAMGGAGAVHLRGPGLPARALFRLLEALRPVQERTGCWLIVNERVDVALAGGGRAVQLTTRSLSVADARLAAPGLPIGASVHSVTEARVAERDGAAWVVAGHVFPTASHPGEDGRGTAFVSAVAGAVAVPVIAIGGITPERVTELRRAGAHGVAVIRGIWEASDAEAAATDYLAMYDADADRPGHDRADAER